MTRLVLASALFVLACSGSKHADSSAPQPAAPANGSASQTTDDAASVPAPPTEGSQPSDVPHGAIDHGADEQRVAQAPPDAGVRAPARDAGAPGGVRDAAAPDAPAPVPTPADAGVPPATVPPTSPR